MITLSQIENAQKKWSNGIIKIGSLINNNKLLGSYLIMIQGNS